MSYSESCLVVDVRTVTADTVILTLESENIACTAAPGQFVNVMADQFLRRPLGIMDVDQERKTFRVGVRIVGQGTAFLARQSIGTHLSVIGPLGNGFSFEGYRNIITVGGGTGVFPLLFVQQRADELGLGHSAVCGYRSPAEVCLADEFRQAAEHSIFTSDQGGLDLTGNATVGLEYLLKNKPQLIDLTTCVMTCGPRPMMKSVNDLAEKFGLSCQVSLEERMACGFGVCLVCVCQVRSNEGEWHNERCCTEGPVFEGRDVKW